MAKITRVTVYGLKDYLHEVGDVSRGIKEVVLHHTWAPTAAQYQGKKTWEAVRSYHVQSRGWSDIGYHFGIGPDSSIWLLRPVEKAGAHVLNRNQHTIGVAMVGNFDVEPPALNGLATAAHVVRILCDHFGLGPWAVRFHREFQNKTCPGSLMDIGDFRSRVFPGDTISVADKHDPPLVIGPDQQVVSTGQIIADRMWAPVADVARALGYGVTWRGDQGKAYLAPGATVDPADGAPGA